MKIQLPEIKFENRANPKSYFDFVRIEELLQRNLDHDICKNHLVNFYILLFVYQGTGYHSIDFVEYKYKPGTVLLIRKDQVQKFFNNNKVKGCLLIFTEDFIIGHLNRMEALKTMQLFNDSLVFPKIEFSNLENFSTFKSLINNLESEYQNKDDFSTGITRSILHIIITKLFRIKAQTDHFAREKKYTSRFLEFQKLVESNCFKSRKVAYYAKEMGVSTKTLNNVVNEVVNKPAKSFIDERTVMQIKRLLISTNHSIKEIAYLAGFSDPTNFYKYFKKHAESTPETFRQVH